MSDEVKYTTSAKILKYLGYGLMGAGMILFVFGISSFFMPSPLPWLDPLYMVMFGLLLLFAGIPLLAMAQQGIIKPEFESIKLIKCEGAPDCKFTQAKKFEKDDYVFKPVEGKCEKCGEPLYIAAIFEVEKKPATEGSEEDKKDSDSATQEILAPPKDVKSEAQ